MRTVASAPASVPHHSFRGKRGLEGEQSSSKTLILGEKRKRVALAVGWVSKVLEGEGDKGVREIGEGNKYIDASPQLESERVFTEKKKRRKKLYTI